MSPLHSLARSCIAPIFLTGGVDALRHPESKTLAAQKLTPQLKGIGLTASATQLVQVNGGVQLVAGLLLSTGRLPRFASTALAISLVPTTLAGHRFWEETDPAAKAVQKAQFFKNLALFGGLLFAATDRNGSPSLTWRAKRSARAASSSLHSVGSSLSSHASHDSIGDRAGVLSNKLRDVAGPLMERGLDLAGEVGSSVAGRAAQVSDTVQARIHS